MILTAARLRADLVKIAACLQLGTAAAVFYTCELGLGLDVGDSFRAVAGLGLGYFARIFIPIEQLVRRMSHGEGGGREGASWGRLLAARVG
jgi:hypothetical protein